MPLGQLLLQLLATVARLPVPVPQLGVGKLTEEAGAQTVMVVQSVGFSAEREEGSSWVSEAKGVS